MPTVGNMKLCVDRDMNLADSGYMKLCLTETSNVANSCLNEAL